MVPCRPGPGTIRPAWTLNQQRVEPLTQPGERIRLATRLSCEVANQMLGWVRKLVYPQAREHKDLVAKFARCMQMGDARQAARLIRMAPSKSVLEAMLMEACMYSSEPMHNARTRLQASDLLLARGADGQSVMQGPPRNCDPAVFVAFDRGNRDLFMRLVAIEGVSKLRRRRGTSLLEDVYSQRRFSLEDSIWAMETLLDDGADLRRLPLHWAHHPALLQLVIDRMSRGHPFEEDAKDMALRELARQTFDEHVENNIRILAMAQADAHFVPPTDGRGTAYHLALESGRLETFLVLANALPVQSHCPTNARGETPWHTLARSLAHYDGYYSAWNELHPDRNIKLERVAHALRAIDYETPDHEGRLPRHVAWANDKGREQWEIVERYAAHNRLSDATAQAEGDGRSIRRL